MKRFRFPLRPVAVLRAHRESRAREVFATAVHDYVQAAAALESTRRRVADFEAALFAHREGRFQAAEEAHNLAGYRREAAEEVAAERALFAANATMAQRRNDYLEAHRQLEVVHRLEAKARSHYRIALGREEQAEFDDFSLRHARHRGTTIAP